MGSSTFEMWEKKIGPKAAEVIKDMFYWVANDYLNNPYAILGLSVASTDNDRLGTTSYANKKVASDSRQTILSSAMLAFKPLLTQTVEALMTKVDDPDRTFATFNMLQSCDKMVLVCVGIAKFEKTICYVFATAKDRDDALHVQALLFELIYAICRTLAPQSEGAYALANNLVNQSQLDGIGLTGEYRKKAIEHVEDAFCHNLFNSIKEWRTQ